MRLFFFILHQKSKVNNYVVNCSGIMMSRPKPKVLNQHVDKEKYRAEQILESEAIWAVYFKGKPFNLRSESLITSNSVTKYKKTSFNNPGHAYTLAKRLNKLFKCEDFAVYKLTTGEKL